MHSTGYESNPRRPGDIAGIVLTYRFADLLKRKGRKCAHMPDKVRGNGFTAGFSFPHRTSFARRLHIYLPYRRQQHTHTNTYNTYTLHRTPIHLGCGSSTKKHFPTLQDCHLISTAPALRRNRNRSVRRQHRLRPRDRGVVRTRGLQTATLPPHHLAAVAVASRVSPSLYSRSFASWLA